MAAFRRNFPRGLSLRRGRTYILSGVMRTIIRMLDLDWSGLRCCELPANMKTLEAFHMSVSNRYLIIRWWAEWLGGAPAVWFVNRWWHLTLSTLIAPAGPRSTSMMLRVWWWTPRFAARIISPTNYTQGIQREVFQTRSVWIETAAKREVIKKLHNCGVDASRRILRELLYFWRVLVNDSTFLVICICICFPLGATVCRFQSVPHQGEAWITLSAAAAAWSCSWVGLTVLYHLLVGAWWLAFPPLIVTLFSTSVDSHIVRPAFITFRLLLPEHMRRWGCFCPHLFQYLRIQCLSTRVFLRVSTAM